MKSLQQIINELKLYLSVFDRQNGLNKGSQDRSAIIKSTQINYAITILDRVVNKEATNDICK